MAHDLAIPVAAERSVPLPQIAFTRSMTAITRLVLPALLAGQKVSQHKLSNTQYHDTIRTSQLQQRTLLSPLPTPASRPSRLFDRVSGSVGDLLIRCRSIEM